MFTLQKMRIAARRIILTFYEGPPERSDVQSALEVWCREVKADSWATSADVKARYRSAVITEGGRVIFDICDMCRLVVRVNYAIGVICVRFVGTPAECNNIDVETI